MAEGKPRAVPTLTRIAGGEMSGRVRAFDWSSTPIGSMDVWSPSLRLAVDMILATNFPMALRWGPDLCLIYNDAYAPALHERHPAALGMRFTEHSPDFQASLRNMHDDILSGASGGYAFDKLPLPVKRDGDAKARIGHFTVNYSPVPDASVASGVGGVLVTAVEITQAVQTEKTLRDTEERYRLAIQAAGGMGAWDWDIKANKVYADPGYAALHALSPDYAQAGLPVQSFTPAVHPDDRARIRDVSLAAMETGGDFADEYRLVQADGSIRWVYTRGSCYLDDEGKPARNSGVVLDITERKETEAALQAAQADLLRQEETLRLAVDAADVGVWELNVESGDLIWSDRCHAMFGVELGQPVTTEVFYGCLHPDDVEATRAAVSRALDPQLRDDYAIEFRTVGRRDGVERWIAAKGQAFFSADGAPLRLRGAIVDITERKRAEMHLRLLVNELNHRVKNSLATIQAIAAQTFNASRSLPEAQEAFSSRIVALAEAHDLLTRENWEGAELHDIAARLAVLHGGSARLQLVGPSIRLSPRAALSLSMALHELATNAVKYGALSIPGGRVVISWDLAPGPGAQRLDLIWTETGGPPVKPPTQRGFGSRLIERGLAAELSGEASIKFEPAGVVCHIRALLDA